MLLLAALVALLPVSASANRWPWDMPKSTLEPGLRLAVVISGVPADFPVQGFDQSRLRGVIVDRLRAAGVEVVGQAEATADPGAALLHVDYRINDTLANYSFLILLKLERKLPLPADPEAYVTKDVWADWKIGGVERQRTDRLEFYTLQLVEEFATQYRADTQWGAAPP